MKEIDVMEKLMDYDATALTEIIKQGEVTSEQVMKTYIEHLQYTNKEVNCVTVDRYNLALEEAKAADRSLRDGEKTGRLHGVPVSIKDCFNVAGMATTGGLKHRLHKLEAHDAAAVAKLKAEGAIVIAKTNTPTLCFSQETDNKLFGRTNNPWNLSRSAGGSSGGEGALIAIGGAAVGLGADIGGSIRFPSHYNGIVGFKSGNHQVDSSGNFPDVSIPEQDRMLGIGGMSKSVRDARLINQILTDSKRKFIDLDAFEIVFSPKEHDIPLGEDTVRLMNQLLEKLQGDYKVLTETPPWFAESATLWQELMSINGASHIQDLLEEDGKRKSLLVEYLKEKVTHKSTIHSYISWALLGAKMFKPSEARLQEIRQQLEVGDEHLARYFKNKLLIMPVYHEAAQNHGKQYGEIFSISKSYKKYMPYIAYANVWGLPSLTMPIGRDSQGMPIGIQVISKVGNEDAIFQFGEWIEETMYAYKRCNYYDLNL